MTTPHSPQQFARNTLRALVLLASVAAALVAAGPSAAAKSCGEQVIDDWYDDGRVDGTYAFDCYDDAVEALPRDVRDYSSAREDIQRALQAAMRGEPAPPARTDPSPDDAGPGKPGEPEDPTSTTNDAPGTPGDDENIASPPTDTESASSIPIPLLVLAGLALLLVLGGAAGYLARRLQARRVPPPAA
jgi:hypothetical protein